MCARSERGCSAWYMIVLHSLQWVNGVHIVILRHCFNSLHAVVVTMFMLAGVAVQPSASIRFVCRWFTHQPLNTRLTSPMMMIKKKKRKILRQSGRKIQPCKDSICVYFPWSGTCYFVVGNTISQLIIKFGMILGFFEGGEGARGWGWGGRIGYSVLFHSDKIVYNVFKIKC
jgi:hypothetical protein